MNVLIVEDNLVLQRMVAEVLRDRGHEVAAFVDAESAWAECQRKHFPLALLDWQLPGMDGLELCRRLRTLPAGKSTVVMVVTGRDQPADLQRVLQAGADDYLAKPVAMGLLKIRLTIAEKLVRDLHERNAAEAALRASELNVQVLRRQLDAHSKPTSLTSQSHSVSKATPPAHRNAKATAVTSAETESPAAAQTRIPTGWTPTTRGKDPAASPSSHAAVSVLAERQGTTSTSSFRRSEPSGDLIPDAAETSAPKVRETPHRASSQSTSTASKPSAVEVLREEPVRSRSEFALVRQAAAEDQPRPNRSRAPRHEDDPEARPAPTPFSRREPTQRAAPQPKARETKVALMVMVKTVFILLTLAAICLIVFLAIGTGFK